MLKPINVSSKIATIGVFIGACVGTVAFVADTPARSQECLALLRVVGVAPDDVLYLRFEPRVPDLEGTHPHRTKRLARRRRIL